MRRLKEIRIATPQKGVMKIVGRGSQAALSFHCGSQPAYNLIENSAELRKFLRDALKRLTPKRRRARDTQPMDAGIGTYGIQMGN